LGNTPKKVLLVHHDRTPQCSIACDAGRNVTKNKCSNGFLYAGMPTCWESIIMISRFAEL
jgi:hypothetical protein